MNLSHIWDWLAKMSNCQTVLLGFALAGVIEGITIFLRFGLGMQSAQDTSWMAPFTLGYRIHHGYIGLLLVLIALAVGGPGRRLLVLLGVALIVSDLVHHFLVLWPITSSPEFHIRYPGYRG